MTPTTLDGVPAAESTGGPVLLSSLTTIGLGGPATRLISAGSAEDVAEALRDPDAEGALVIGGGSNLIVADAGLTVPVVRVAIPGLRYGERAAGPDGSTELTVGAGENWDDVVAAVVGDGFTGIETLSGIPGYAGATPIQNVGAYGTEISSVLADVTVYDRMALVHRTLPAADLALGYRTSVLRGTDSAVVTGIRLRLGREPRPVRYAELARTLGVEIGTPVPPDAVRDAVLDLRRAKGMVIDPDDPDTRSAGSFFTNPILRGPELAAARAAIERRLGAEARCPTYPAQDGSKLSAAWLIERAGFGKGYALPGSGAAVSGKHSLALTNRGGATTDELLALARTIRRGVLEAFSVALEPEPVLVGVVLGD